jgi:hypothetical protein
VQFEDPALKEALLMLLPGDLDGEPCAGEFDAAEITDVSMQDVGIFSLEGFQCFRADGLTVVRLQHNAIRDVSPLADFAGLTQLYLVDNWIQDLSYLSGLTSLTYLSLSDNDVSNLAPLAALTALQTLYLSNNFIVKVTALTSLVDLGKAELSSNFITDIGPLVGLQKLVSLNLNQNHIHDLPSFQCLGELKTLEVVKNKITDLAGLVNSNGLAGPGVSVKVTSNPIDCAGQVDNIRTLVCCWGIVLTTTCPAPTAAECAEADCASHPVPPCQ